MTNFSRRLADTPVGRGVPTFIGTEKDFARMRVHEGLVRQMKQKRSWTGLVTCEWDFKWPEEKKIDLDRDPYTNIFDSAQIDFVVNLPPQTYTQPDGFDQVSSYKVDIPQRFGDPFRTVWGDSL